jgi:hypothetical protein
MQSLPKPLSYGQSDQAHAILSILEQRLIPGRPLSIEKDSIGRYTVKLGAHMHLGVSITDALAQLCQAVAAPVVLHAALVPPALRSRQASK